MKQLIIFNNLPARCSFRIISQNSELRLAVHDNSVIEIMDKVFEKYSKNDNFLLEIGDVSLLSEIGLRKKDFDRQIELEDDTNIVVAEYMIKHIAKDNIKIGIITALNEEFEAMQNFCGILAELILEPGAWTQLCVWVFAYGKRNCFNSIVLY